MLSVVLCTYNGEKFIETQLSSIINQSKLPDELLISDDHSTDRTIVIAEQVLSSVPFSVRIYRNEKNVGSTKNFEQAIQRSNGDVILLADQDDVWKPHKIAKVHSCFEANPLAGLVFSDAELVDETLAPFGLSMWASIGFNSAEQIQMRNGNSLDVLLKHHVVTGATAAFRAEYRDLLLPISSNWIHDAWISFIISLVAEVIPVPEPLIHYRQHSNNQIGTPIGLFNIARFALQNRKNSLQSFIDQYRDLYHHIEQSPILRDNDVPLRRIREKLQHLKFRNELPRAKILKTLPIISELLNGGYHRYARGLRSATRDWLTSVD